MTKPRGSLPGRILIYFLKRNLCGLQFVKKIIPSAVVTGVEFGIWLGDFLAVVTSQVLLVWVVLYQWLSSQ